MPPATKVAEYLLSHPYLSTTAFPRRLLYIQCRRYLRTPGSGSPPNAVGEFEARRFLKSQVTTAP
jgi:hypothetical protein